MNNPPNYEEDIDITPEDIKTAESNGIKYNTLYNRINYYGYTKEYATTVPPKKDEEYQYWRKQAKLNGISGSTFHSRVRKYDYSYEDAATKPIKNSGRCRKLSITAS